MDDWSWDFCPHCATEGHISDLTTIQLSSVAVKICENEDCPSESLVMYTEDRHHQDAPVPEHCLIKLNLPITLAMEPKMKYCHGKTVMWLNWVRHNDVYLLLQAEVNTICYIIKNDSRHFYIPPPTVKRLLELTNEEVQVGKHVIPDLYRIVTCLRYYKKVYEDFRCRFSK